MYLYLRGCSVGNSNSGTFVSLKWAKRDCWRYSRKQLYKQSRKGTGSRWGSDQRLKARIHIKVLFKFQNVSSSWSNVIMRWLDTTLAHHPTQVLLCGRWSPVRQWVRRNCPLKGVSCMEFKMVSLGRKAVTSDRPLFPPRCVTWLLIPRGKGVNEKWLVSWRQGYHWIPAACTLYLRTGPVNFILRT